jgi:hypothetical protein
VQRLIIFLLIISYACPSFSAFFNIRKAEKDELIQCGLYLYFQHNKITCPEIEEDVTVEIFDTFLKALRLSYDSEYKLEGTSTVQEGSMSTISEQEWVKKLPEAYQTYDAFKKNIGSFCKNGKSVCQKIQRETENRPMFQRKKCNTFCSANTCKDAFTMATCFAMSQSNALNNQPICPSDTVKRCLRKENNLALVKTLALRSWPREWNDLEAHWDQVFFATATEPAKGKHIGLRMAQAGGVMGVVAALPFLMHAVIPGFVLFGGWSTKYLTVHGIDSSRSKLSGVLRAKLSKLTKKIAGNVSLVSKSIDGCFCQCPR